MSETPTLDEMPDWPPAGPAWMRSEGAFAYGSTGQKFVVQNGQWLRVRKPKLVNDDQ